MRRFSHLLLLTLACPAYAADGNRLAYLDSVDPYYVSRTFPRLTTPQWVGEDGVEAVVILSIDDMRDPAKYEKFLRPILNRLKKIDGRAPLSIMSCAPDPKAEQLQIWLKEGLSLETHTYDHPCPLLAKGDLAKARETYERCVDLMATVPNSRPVAFRTPCCDSQNTLSPRFFSVFTNLFSGITAKDNFLEIDSSVFNQTTPDDPELPRDLVFDSDGREHTRKYLPTDRAFGNHIEDYPYPYVINRLCWEIPCVTPTDWQGQHYHKANGHPALLQDWKATLDAAVIKKGVFCLVLHPYGWSKPEQIVELIDHAVSKHGKKIKFLNFKEVRDRLTKNALGGVPLRDPKTGKDNGVRLLDVNNDGFIDVVIGNSQVKQTRLWSPKESKWITGEFPIDLVKLIWHSVCFGVLQPDGKASLIADPGGAGWHFNGSGWTRDEHLTKGITIRGPAVLAGFRLLDLDGDGICELIQADRFCRTAYSWSVKEKSWMKLPFEVPQPIKFIYGGSWDYGVRFIDIDEDGRPDLIFSTEDQNGLSDGYGLYLFSSLKDGWSRKVLAGKPGDKGALPLIARDKMNMGAWFLDRQLWVQNEHTAILKDLVDRRSFNDLLAAVEPTAKTPEASLRCLRPRPGFQVEQAAAEPLLGDPIAFAWGPDGKLWVVEMGDYPLGTDGKGKAGGRVLYLEDTDGDGKYTKATVFLDNLPFPTGVLPWRKGVLITCAPDILYAEDTKGTGKADKVVKLYSGFREGNQQHRINSLVWGLDNWIYCANGDSDGSVKSLKTGTVVNISGRDLRIRPDDGLIDLQTGRTQYGRSRDDWGNWFGNNNSNPMWQFVLADHYIRRNPHIAAPAMRVDVPVVPGASRVYPISRTLPRFNSPQAANHFTSACGSMVYRDDLFGPRFSNSAFVSEPVHNLVHREVLFAEGCTVKSRRDVDEQESEFLASSDNWFRPTMLQTGPDGALWVADMYRAVIEHPEWIPKDWQKKLDLRAGHDKGRIYRVFPVGVKPRKIPRLDKLDTAGLVTALDSPSGWQRDTAQMMLLWRNDSAAVPLLEKMTTDCQRPLGRLHALCTLDGLNALKPEIICRALKDSHPGVRVHAVRLSERLLPKSAELGDALVKLTADSEAPVRLQLAYSLGEWDDPKAGRALGELAVKDAGDRFIAAAVISSVNAKNLDAVLLAVMASSKNGPPPADAVQNLLRLANALKQTKALATLLNAVAKPEGGRYAAWQYHSLAGLLDFLDQQNTSLAKLGDGDNAEIKAALERIAGMFAAARSLIADAKAALEEKLAAVRLLGRGLDRQSDDLKLLAGLLIPQMPSELQTAAVASLAQLRDPSVPALLLAGWKGYGPMLRVLVIDALLRRDAWTKALLNALEKKDVLAGDFDAPRRQRLVQHKDAAIRKRAATLFAGAINPDRQKVIDAYQGVLKLKGDPARGAMVFAKHCAACHRLGKVGNAVGPDFESIGDKSPQGLLTAILDPNRVVESRYVNYVAVTKAGLTLTGVLASETGNSITLLAAEGKQHVILRRDLDELVSTGKSPMPEGMEKEIPPADMADLFAHLRAAGPGKEK